MQESVTLTIDGSLIRAPKGTPVLEAALRHGICIPHLCHMPGISPSGACRLCIVEVVDGDRTKVTASCSLDVQEGMVIRSNSEKIRRLRRNIAELLVAQAPNSRVIQDIAARCGVENVRYPFRNSNCVQCGRCVRACEELWQARAIGFVGRGKDRRVDYPFGIRPDFCKQCGYCIELCPMTITPCGGPMKVGEEHLCAQCASQLSMERESTGACYWCDLGEGLHCIHRTLV
jgi:bidirectional [NiFe] hydrogenase diaphorase subunit